MWHSVWIILYFLKSTGSFSKESPNISSIMKDLSWSTKMEILRDTPSRRVGVERQQEPTEPPKDEGNMKLKLFRLMYETVRDSDLKVKRAELIRKHYTNSSAFDIGFIMGDITDKMTTMSEVSATLKRLYSEWKPMEHINGYEQIANKAIEITNLIDMIRIIDKKNALSTSAGSKVIHR